MDTTALFKLTYGLFIAGCSTSKYTNACVVNTAIQTTSTPNTMSVTMLKTNLTTDLICEKGSLTISVIGRDTPLETIHNFGMGSGRERNKFANYAYELDTQDNPYITEDMLAIISLKVTQQLDLGTHIMFLCDVIDCETLSDTPPMTYADYRTLKLGGSLTASTEPKKAYTCSVCHYVYDGEVPFEDLPDDWVCPLCGQGKSVFVLQ